VSTHRQGGLVHWHLLYCNVRAIRDSLLLSFSPFDRSQFFHSYVMLRISPFPVNADRTFSRKFTPASSLQETLHPRRRRYQVIIGIRSSTSSVIPKSSKYTSLPTSAITRIKPVSNAILQDACLRRASDAAKGLNRNLPPAPKNQLATSNKPKNQAHACC